jgi:ADP-heptose:LPS heptosyltransferase
MATRKLILRCGLSPGDIVMLTAAVRDLHYWHPGKFLTDVRTSSQALWEHNPYLSPLSDSDGEVEFLDCSYPLINFANRTPYHCLHGFIEFLNQRLGLAIRPTAFKGDIHLSAQEKAWYSQVHELTGENTPFWIVAAGGKYDVTIKWWESQRYQAVIDHFQGRIQFVQVGGAGHHHPRLKGVIDLRGKTTLRELVRLVYHSQGVLCSVTALMHLAAAVETPPGRPARRPCVVIAGGREPAHWEAYPDHQFIHTNGALACCRDGGCWKDRVQPLRDGDHRDRPGHLCVQVTNRLPQCMDLITPSVVIDRIETYFKGGAFRYLLPRRRSPALRGVRATARNPYDQQPLNLHNAGLAGDTFVAQLAPPAELYQGRGIVIAGGGVRYFTCAWVCIKMLRRLGCRLPIEFWHLGDSEMDRERRSLLADLDVKCVDAHKVREEKPCRTLGGWELKPYAILHSAFREVLFLDADNVPVRNPEFLFEDPAFRKTGALFWPDFELANQAKAAPIWKSCGLRAPREPEFETGQMLFDKQRCSRALRLALWFNEHSDFYYRHLHGDKETFHLAFRKLKQPYSLVPHPVHSLAGTMCQHDLEGRRLFQHRNRDKWDLLLHNRQVPGFRFEKECRQHLVDLRRRWDGGLKSLLGPEPSRRNRRPAGGEKLKFAALVMSWQDGDAQGQTVKNLAYTDWDSPVVEVRMAGQEAPKTALRCVRASLNGDLAGVDYFLLLEEDLEFNRYLDYNLRHWKPLLEGGVRLAGLSNPRVRELACDIANNARLMDARSTPLSGALLVSQAALDQLMRSWRPADGRYSFPIARLTSRLQPPILYHAPSLAQPISGPARAQPFPQLAIDFNRTWKA